MKGGTAVSSATVLVARLQTQLNLRLVDYLNQLWCPDDILITQCKIHTLAASPECQNDFAAPLNKKQKQKQQQQQQQQQKNKKPPETI